MEVLTDLLFGLEPIRAIQGFFGTGHTVPFRAMSMFGDTWGILLAVGIGFWLFGRRSLYALVGITIFAAGTWLVVSGLFDVSRPEGQGIVVYDHLEFGAFPSGHTTQAGATWGMLYAMGFVPIVIPILVAALTGFGRIYLGAHFLGDVLGGMVYAALVVAVFFVIWQRIRGWLAQRSASFYLAVAGVALAAGLTWLAQLPADASERRMEVVVVLIVAALAMPAEHRWLRYSPPRLRPWRSTTLGVIGIAGLALLFLLTPYLPWRAPVSAGLAVAWVVLGAPALFQQLGWDGDGVSWTPYRQEQDA